ncbi:MAG: heat-inducible transcription repressor HrcA [Chloroflexi bacterium]|nr:heat-inducible transcription repressor HrcA [Chloroflexota bacterium]
MLTSRRAQILRFIVTEYVSTGQPVGSEGLAQSSGLQVSAATIRNEMAVLEEEGYVLRPHVSAGAVPSDKGYRVYVDTLAQEAGLTAEEQRLLRHQFAQVGVDLEEWLGLAAAMLARLAHNLALVTYPKVTEVRLKRLGLVGLQPTLALLVLVLYQARVRHTPLPLEAAVEQGELDRVANYLTDLYQGFTLHEFKALPGEASAVGKRALEACSRLMMEEEAEAFDAPLVEGLGEFAGQPEFSHTEKAIEVVELARVRLRYLLPRLLMEDPVRVIIGTENPEEELRSLTLVLAPYGAKGLSRGVLGLMGPTRMPYDRSISAIRYLALLLNEAMSHYYD